METKISERDDIQGFMQDGFIYAHLEDKLLSTAVLLYHMMTGASKVLCANEMPQDLTKITMDLWISPRLPLPSSITSGKK